MALNYSSSLLTATVTLTNKRIQKRVLYLTNNSTIPFTNGYSTNSYDVVRITGQGNSITSMTTGLSGNPVDGDTLRISITATSNINIGWGSLFENSTVTLPSATVGSNRLDVGFVYNAATSAWRCVAVA